MWGNDNHNWVPPAYWDRRGGPAGTYNILEPYIGDTDTGDKVFLCPKVPKEYAGKTLGELDFNELAVSFGNEENFYNSYGINIKLVTDTNQCPGQFDSGNDNNTQWGRNNVWYKTHGNCKFDSITMPNRTILFSDSIVYVSNYGLFNKSVNNPNLQHQDVRGRRHDVSTRNEGPNGRYKIRVGEMNIVWVDGSVTGEPDDLDQLNPAAPFPVYEVNGRYWHGYQTSN